MRNPKSARPGRLEPTPGAEESRSNARSVARPEDRFYDDGGLPRLLDVTGAAQRLSISERQLWAMAHRGDLASVRIGRRLLFDPRDIALFIEEKKTHGPRGGMR